MYRGCFLNSLYFHIEINCARKLKEFKKKILVSQFMSQILADVCSAETSKHEYLEKSSNNTNTIVTYSCGLVGVFPYMFFKIKFQEKIYKKKLSCSIEKHQVFFHF